LAKKTDTNAKETGSYVYGGQQNGDIFGDIYVLSLPSFRWTRIDVDSDWRAGQTCYARGRQMIVSGGFWRWTVEDKWASSLGVFDLSRLEWASRYDPNAEEYVLPERIQQK
jgi:hypothetical protein